MTPAILEQVRPGLVVWSSLWPARPDGRIRFDIEAEGSATSLRWTLLTPDDPPDAELLDHMRHRLNHLINGELRSSFG